MKDRKRQKNRHDMRFFSIRIDKNITDLAVECMTDAREDIAVIACDFVLVVVVDDWIANLGSLCELVARDAAFLQRSVQRQTDLCHGDHLIFILINI